MARFVALAKKTRSVVSVAHDDGAVKVVVRGPKLVMVWPKYSVSDGIVMVSLVFCG